MLEKIEDSAQQEAMLRFQQKEIARLNLEVERLDLLLTMKKNFINELDAAMIRKDTRVTELEAQLSAALATIERACGEEKPDGKLYAEGCAP